MKKKIDRLMIITTLLALLPMALGALWYQDLPEQVAVHFNAAGEADGYASRAFAAFGMPAILAALNVVTHFVLNSDPKRENASKALSLIGKCVVPVISILCCGYLLCHARNVDIAPIQTIVPLLLGVLFILIGNYMPKCKQNYTVGIKISWTLHSEENWNKTHHLAGWLWMIGGLCVMPFTFFLNGYLPYLLLPLLLVMVLVPIVYSYCLYKKGI